MGIISSIIDLVNTVIGHKKDKKRRKNDEEIYKQQESVPFFYKTRDERMLQTKRNSAYSVEGILKSLKEGVLPIGYSFETLKLTGFEKEYNDMIKREDKIISDLVKKIKTNYQLLLDNILENRELNVFKSGSSEFLSKKIKELLAKDIAEEDIPELNQDINEIQTLFRQLNIILKRHDTDKDFIDHLQSRRDLNARNLGKLNSRIGQLIGAQALKKAGIIDTTFADIGKISTSLPPKDIEGIKLPSTGLSFEER